jgi:pyruvate dehydrogenase (quinone)
VEENNPYQFFQSSAVYIGRLVNPHQLRTVVTAALSTAVGLGGPSVISIPGDVAAADAPEDNFVVKLARPSRPAASADDLAAIAGIINGADTVAIFGGYGCIDAASEVRQLSES